MKIVIGIDDSAQSRAAVEFVRAQPWPAGSEALVLSAVEAATQAFIESAGARGVEAFYPRIERHQAAQVEEAKRRLASAGLAVSGRVVRSDARAAIVEVARDERADLVVVGSHGRSGLKRVLLGSVAEYVVTHAPCDVLVVKGRG